MFKFNKCASVLTFSNTIVRARTTMVTIATITPMLSTIICKHVDMKNSLNFNSAPFFKGFLHKPNVQYTVVYSTTDHHSDADNNGVGFFLLIVAFIWQHRVITFLFFGFGVVNNVIFVYFILSFYGLMAKIDSFTKRYNFHFQSQCHMYSSGRLK